MIEYYPQPELCTTCGGKCCKNIPGATRPSDFKGRQQIIEALRGGRYCVDWWEGDPRKRKNTLKGKIPEDVATGIKAILDELHEHQEVLKTWRRGYFIRPAGKGFEGRLLDPSWGGIGCTFLTDTGCSLEPEQRPTQCRLLQPDATGHCIDHSGGKREAAIAWLKHDVQGIIDEVQRRS